MKKTFIIAFGMIFLCGLMMHPAFVNATNSAYSYTNYEASNTHVEDGKWTSTTEWQDAQAIPNLVTGFSWRGTWTWPSDIIQHFIIEVYTDNTNSTGDIVNFCYDTVRRSSRRCDTANRSTPIRPSAFARPSRACPRSNWTSCSAALRRNSWMRDT